MAGDAAAPRRRGLGMGLSALLGDGAEVLRPGAGEASRTVPIEFLRPSSFQPRRRFDAAELAALTDSVRVRGVLQPLVVRRCDGGYEIVAGERRWRAAQAAGRHEVPVVVHDLSDREALELALIENIQRQDLSPLEEAEGYRRLIDEFGHTQDELARALGRSRSHVANALRLLRLPEPVRAMVEDGRLTAGHARALLAVPDAAEVTALAQEVAGRALNVRQTEALMRRRGGGGRAAAPRRPDPDLAALERRLSDGLGLRVSLTSDDRGGTLRIAFSSPEQLDGLLERLLQGARGAGRPG